MGTPNNQYDENLIAIKAHDRIDKLEDRVLLLETNTVQRDGPFTARLRHVEDTVLRIETNTKAIKTETESHFTRNQAWIITGLASIGLIVQAIGLIVYH